MELNDNSSNAKPSKINTNEYKNPKESVICTFCSKRIEDNFSTLNSKPELLGTLAQLEIEIPPINDWSDYICYQCVFKIHCIQDCKRIWSANINKSRINYYYRRGDKEMVRRLITLKPSTSTRASHHSLRTRSNGSSFNGNGTKEGSIISQSTDNNSNLGHDDCLQNKTNETIPAKATTDSNILSEIRISSVNSLHIESVSNKSKHQKRSASLIEKKLKKKSKPENTMPRRSSVLTNETTDLNHTNNSNLMENGFFQESSIHIADNTISPSSNKANQKSTELLGKSSSPTSPNNLLNIMYEENEPAGVTESGGEISSRVSSHKDTVTMKCKYCERIYKKLAFLVKHQRKHERDNQKTISMNSKANSKVVTIHNCPECNQTFPTKYRLNQHKKSHLKVNTCQYCSKEFRLKWEAEFHEAVCSGKIHAMEPTDENCANTSNGALITNRYYTRSAKSKSYKETEKTNNKLGTLNPKQNGNNNGEEPDEDELSDTTEIDSLFSSRMRNTKKWTEEVVQMQNENDEGETNRHEGDTQLQNNIEIGTNSFCFDDTGQSFNTFNGYEIPQNNNVSQENEFNSKKLKKSKSTKKTRISKQNNTTKNIDNPSPIVYDEYCDISSESYNDDAVFFFIKCQNNDCEYQNVKLENVMKHDNDTHGIRPLYYCKKCKGSFLRKYYFELHCSNQDPGCFLCYLCRAEFFYEELLHMHLEEHRTMEYYNEVYPCKLCNMKFLDETSLMKHLATKEHLKLKAAPRVNFKIKNSYPILRKRQQENGNNNSSNMIYDKTLLKEGQLLYNSCNVGNNIDLIQNDVDLTSQKYVSKTKILKLKKYESKNFKYECNCIKKNCYNCQKHRKMIPIYGREPKPTKHYPYRSCNEVKLPFLKTWYFSYI